MHAIETVRLGLAPDFVPYEVAWDEQRRLHDQVAADPDARGTVLLLEHEPVYTAGRRTASWRAPGGRHPRRRRRPRRPDHLARSRASSSATRSCALADPLDVVAYVRRSRTLLIDVCAELGLATVAGRGPHRRLGAPPTGAARTARWPPSASGCRRGVTMHGFALNCDCDLSAFDRIVPCGIDDADGHVADRRARPYRHRRRRALGRRWSASRSSGTAGVAEAWRGRRL